MARDLSLGAAVRHTCGVATSPDESQLNLFGVDLSAPKATRSGVGGRAKPDPDTPVLPAAVSDEVRGLAAGMPAGVFMGTSSWSFPGWKGLIYEGEHTTAALARRGLSAYAAHPMLRSVGLDKTYYAPIPESEYAHLRESVPAGFRFLVKAHSAIMQPTVSAGGGWKRNELFLDAGYAADMVVEPAVRGLGAACGPILFQFSPMRLRERGAGALTPERVLDRLEVFLSRLPRRTDASAGFYAVEIRNPELLTERYARMLAEFGVSHGFCAHPAMPGGIARQMEVVGDRVGPAAVCRWLLHEGETYEGTRERYAPFDRIVDDDPAVRGSVVGLVEQAVRLGRLAWLIVNNKAEGSAPQSVIEAWALLSRRLRERAGA